MWTSLSTLLEIILRSTIIYFVVLLGIRLTGKREVGQMTPFDLVLLLLIANVVQNAMTGPDTSLIGGLVGAVTLLCINAVMGRLVWRNRRLNRLVEGTPTLLIHSGNLLRENLQREQITVQELHQALREHGVASTSDVYLATLEIDGSISVLRNDEKPTLPQPHHHIRLMRTKTT